LRHCGGAAGQWACGSRGVNIYININKRCQIIITQDNRQLRGILAVNIDSDSIITLTHNANYILLFHYLYVHIFIIILLFKLGVLNYEDAVEPECLSVLLEQIDFG